MSKNLLYNSEKPLYYDGCKLLSLMDINGNKPEIYITTSNRASGKTTYFSKTFFNKFLKYNEQTCLLYRFVYELADVPVKFFSGIQELFFPAYDMEAVKHCRGSIIELKVNDKTFGFAVALNSADNVRKYSHMFSKVTRMFLDEFQSESGQYCNDEIKKFISVHTSIARGGGHQSRRVPVYLCSNSVSLLNPYFIELGISDRLKKDTKYMRGNGWVLEQAFNESAAQALSTSAFNQAFSNNPYFMYAAQNVYLEDDTAFIEKPPNGTNKYLATFTTDLGDFALRSYSNEGIVYCSKNVDKSNPNKLVTSFSNHKENYLMLNLASPFIIQLRSIFERGCFRFQNQICKTACLNLLAYR